MKTKTLNNSQSDVKYIFYLNDVDRLNYIKIGNLLYSDLKMFIQSLRVLEQNLHKLGRKKEADESLEVGLRSKKIYVI